MKILYYIPSLYNSGGTERIITLKANYFADQLGYDVIILTSEQKSKEAFFPLSDKIKLADLNVEFDTNSYRSRIIKNLLYPFRYFLFKKRFSNALFLYKPDITISTLRRELFFIHSLRDSSIKIGEFHYTRKAYIPGYLQGSGFFKNIARKYWTTLFSSNLQKLSKVVLLTKKESSNWPELTNTVVIHNPLSFFPASTSDCEKKKVIAVGRYVREKGFDLLIDAWNIVHQKYPEWKLHIYGGSGKNDQLNKQINLLGLNNSCSLEKQVKNIEEKYLESSIFVLSSRNEGFGMVIAEAMACGVPPVAFACDSGPDEIINDKVDGFLIEPENIKELANNICYLIENKDVRKTMGKNARKNIERLKIGNIADQWVRVFDDLKDTGTKKPDKIR